MSMATICREAGARPPAPCTARRIPNYFPTKERLVIDRDEELHDRLVHLIRSRPPGVSPAAAIRDEALRFADGIRDLPADQVRGGLGHLAAVSPTVRRLSLEMTDRHADAIARVLLETGGTMDPAVAKVQGIALAWVFQIISDETGRRARQDDDPRHIADELHSIVEALIEDLDRWLRP